MQFLRIFPLESIMTDKQADSIVVIEGNDGFLGALVPDFSALLEHQLTTSSALGPKDSETSYRMDLVRFNRWHIGRPVNQQKIDKTLIEEYLNTCWGKPMLRRS